MAGIMRDWLFDSKSHFDRKKSELSHWLKTKFSPVRTLNQQEVQEYKGRNFASGWEVVISTGGQNMMFHVLIDYQFPYSIIRVAYKTEDTFLKWPHVEKLGVLCLPETPLALNDFESSINDSLYHAVQLVTDCQQNQQYVDDELRREFLSYWGQSANNKATKILSLLDPNNKTSCIIFVWYGSRFTLVADTEDQIQSWLEHHGNLKKQKISVIPALFGKLNNAPIPPFPENAPQLYNWLKKDCPSIESLLKSQSVGNKLTIVLGADSPNGTGLVAIQLNKKDKSGFRKYGYQTLSNKNRQWFYSFELERRRVERCDSSWVHGRGMDKHHSDLHSSSVLIVGCGSLGSQVAKRLAQSGVGKLTLLDPEELSAANIGRHELGMDYIGLPKAKALADSIRHRYPHMQNVEGHESSWQRYFSEYYDDLKEHDLIVACLGEWSQEGLLSEWHTRSDLEIPIVYGFLEEQGIAAHAIAVTGEMPSFNCIFNNEGILREPESTWGPESQSMQVEPACGTLFQPYGSIDVVHSEALVARMVIDILSGKVKDLPVHHVYAGSTDQIESAGGSWSDLHMEFRPPGFRGPFEYERPIKACDECSACKGS